MKKIETLLRSSILDDVKIGIVILYNKLGDEKFKEYFSRIKPNSLLHNHIVVVLRDDYVIYAVPGGYRINTTEVHDKWGGHIIDLRTTK